METFANLADGFAIALTWNNLWLALLGCFLGTIMGALPAAYSHPLVSIAMWLFTHCDDVHLRHELLARDFDCDHTEWNSAWISSVSGPPVLSDVAGDRPSLKHSADTSSRFFVWSSCVGLILE